MHRGTRRPGYGVLLLAYQVFGVIGMKYIPPVTLSLVALHSAIYLRIFKLPWYKSSQVCVSVISVWYKKEYKRILYAAFEHGDDWHLYYNMMSFIVKGRSLEKRFGTVKFLFLVLLFAVSTNVTLVALSFLASEFHDNDYDYHCAVGFSGVLFALKVLTSYYDPNYTHQIMGIPVMIPARYAVWFELVLIQLLVPNVSFLGHLAGILMGLLYVKSPLGYLVDALYSVVSSVIHPRPTRFHPTARPTGYASQQTFSEFSPAGMNENEQLRRATEASLHDQRSTFSHNERHSDLLSDEDIRRRRLAHYQ